MWIDNILPRHNLLVLVQVCPAVHINSSLAKSRLYVVYMTQIHGEKYRE